MPSLKEFVSENFKRLREEAAQSAVKAGRSPGEVQILAVSKRIDASFIHAAYELGCRAFGENLVQELERKITEFPEDIDWHMIGSLQTNKVKKIIGRVKLIHSLDRPELYHVLHEQAQKRLIQEVPVLIQVNASRESSKSGIAPEKLEAFLEEIHRDSPVKICGLMAMGPLTEDDNQIRACFREMKQLFEKTQERLGKDRFNILSMGMSHDFKIAIEEGSTLIRVGSRLFGERNSK